MYYPVGLLYKLSTIGIPEVPMNSKTLDKKSDRDGRPLG
jgi:hypothetical protein